MKNKLIGSLFVVAFSLLALAQDSSPETAARLLKGALKPSSVAYKGRLNVTHWTRKGATSEDARIWYRPPNLYRCEFLRPDGRIDRVLITEGASERLELDSQGLALKGRAAHNQPKQLAPDKEWALLMRNYQVNQTGTEQVAGRSAWIVEVSPRNSGKPTERLWVDGQTGVVLAVKRFESGERHAVFSRFVQFQLNPDDLDAAFAPNTVKHESINHGYDPDFLSPEDYQNQTGHAITVPRSLPMGFQLESIDIFQADGHSIVHYRFTDGLSAVSLFQSDRPARFADPKSIYARPVAWEGSSLLHVNQAGHILQDHSGKRYLTLISDLSPTSMQVILGALK